MELIRYTVFTKDRWPGLPPIPGAMQAEDGNFNMNELLKGLAKSTESNPGPAATK